jgi:hypothetical protein
MERRRYLLARGGLVLDALVCGSWAYWAATSMLRRLYETGSGGIAGVSVSAGLLESLSTIVPPIVTILLARASGTRLARFWRNAHLAALLALITLPMLGDLRVMMVSIVVMLPVQLFFVVGAFIVWFEDRRTPAVTPER